MLEEPRLGRRQPGQELEAEVLRHEPVVAAEARGARRARRAGLQRQRRQVQAGGPALRPLGQLGQLARVELDSRGLAAATRPRCSSSRRSADADLVHAALRPPAGKRQRRLFPAGDRDLRAGRNVLEQRRKHVQTRPDWRRRADRRAPAPAGARARPARSRRAGRASSRSIRLGPTARRTPRARPVRRGESRPRCSAGTPRRRRRAPSSATHANGRGSASAHRASSVVLPYPAGATTVANGERDVHSRAITSAFATVPGRISGAASLTSTRSNGSSATSIARRSVAAGARAVNVAAPMLDFMPSG